MPIENIVTHYVEFLTPGSLYSERYTRPLTTYGELGGVEILDNTFCYSFYSIELKRAVVDGEVFEKHSDRINKSGRYYIKGTIYKIDQIPNPEQHRTLIFNLSQYDTEYAVHCNMGNWQPFFQDKDTIV